MATRRTKQQIVADIEAKIAYHEACIAKLNTRKEEALKPPARRTRKTSMRQALDAIKEAGLTPDEIVALASKAKRGRKPKADEQDA